MTTKPLIPLTRAGLAALVLYTISVGLYTTAHAVNITAFGDSITSGQGSNTGGYPQKLSDLLNANSKPAVVANFGIGGENTYEGIFRFDSVLAAFPASIILIMEGTNDIVVGLSAEATKYNLQIMIDKAKAAKVTPLLSTLTPSDRNGSATLIPEVWNPMIATLAGSNSIHLVDNYAATSPTWGALNNGGLHPNDSGYQVIAGTWYATLAGMITSTGTVSSDSTDSTGGGGGGGCFIATAAFGSPAEKHVMLLKEFRDTLLLSNSLGRQFVDAYYQYSPAVADFISQHENLKLLVRVFLYPLITISYLLLKLSLPMQFALATLIVASCLALSTTVVRRRRKA